MLYFSGQQWRNQGPNSQTILGQS